jgi:hypothetical protein
MWIFRAVPRVGKGVRRGIRLGIPHPRNGIGNGRNQDIGSAHYALDGKIADPDFMLCAEGTGGPVGSPEKPGGFSGSFKRPGKGNLAPRGLRCAPT